MTRVSDIFCKLCTLSLELLLSLLPCHARDVFPSCIHCISVSFDLSFCCLNMHIYRRIASKTLLPFVCASLSGDGMCFYWAGSGYYFSYPAIQKSLAFFLQLLEDH